MTMFPCGCADDECTPCETHSELIVVREGASIRTGDDLQVTFIEDAMSLGVVLAPWGRDTLAACNANLAANEHHGVRHLSDDPQGWELQDDLGTLHNQVENELLTMDENYVVVFNDGYVIYQLHPDCPLVEE